MAGRDRRSPPLPRAACGRSEARNFQPLGSASRIHPMIRRLAKFTKPLLFRRVSASLRFLRLPSPTTLEYLLLNFGSSISHMRVLGIDPGSETLGWGVVDGSGTRY